MSAVSTNMISPQVLANVSQQLLDELTDGGERDLTELRLEDIESEVYELVDMVTRKLLRGVLEDQAIQADAQVCPRCQNRLEDKPTEERELQLKRNRITWKQPVKHCSQCRCDFFPSVQNIGCDG